MASSVIKNIRRTTSQNIESNVASGVSVVNAVYFNYNSKVLSVRLRGVTFSSDNTGWFNVIRLPKDFRALNSVHQGCLVNENSLEQTNYAYGVVECRINTDGWLQVYNANKKMRLWGEIIFINDLPMPS